MRLLPLLAATVVLAAPASAAASPAASPAAPRFEIFDLKSDLAHASRNGFGDVAVKPRARLAGHGTLVECRSWCRFGTGWLAFSGTSHLARADVASAAVRYSPRRGWTVRLTLRGAARARWSAFVRGLEGSARLAGVPDVLVVVAGGRVAATPLASEVASAGGRVTLTGFTKPSATAVVQALR